MSTIKRMKIYIAGPYSNTDPRSVEKNVQNAIDAGLVVWKKGHYPFIPHLTHFIDVYARRKGIPMQWKEYIEWDKPWLKCCDALLYLGKSRGAEQELKEAKLRGLVVYQGLEEIPNMNKKGGVLSGKGT